MHEEDSAKESARGFERETARAQEREGARESTRTQDSLGVSGVYGQCVGSV